MIQIANINPDNFIKEKYNNSLRAEIYNKISFNSCPFCKSKSFIKYGSFKGIQRYKCKECKKTFSNATKSMYSYSKKYISDWSLYFKYMLEKKSLRFIADKVGISLSTSFTWRHKIMEALKSIVIAPQLEGKVFIALGKMKDNFKGCRNIKNLNILTREYVTIAAAYGRCDSFIASPISRRIFLHKVFEERIYSKISKDAYIVPYTLGVDKLVEKHNNWTFLNTRTEKRIQYFDYKFEKWTKSFKGVATRYLQRYLHYYGMFILFKKFTLTDILCILNKKIDFKYSKYSLDTTNMYTKFKI